MPEDKCPYVFCPKCRQPNTWERSERNDIKTKAGDLVMWRGWICKRCGEVAREPTELIKSKV